MGLVSWEAVGRAVHALARGDPRAPEDGTQRPGLVLLSSCPALPLPGQLCPKESQAQGAWARQRPPASRVCPWAQLLYLQVQGLLVEVISPAQILSSCGDHPGTSVQPPGEFHSQDRHCSPVTQSCVSCATSNRDEGPRPFSLSLDVASHASPAASPVTWQTDMGTWGLRRQCKTSVYSDFFPRFPVSSGCFLLSGHS